MFATTITRFTSIFVLRPAVARMIDAAPPARRLHINYQLYLKAGLLPSAELENTLARCYDVRNK